MADMKADSVRQFRFPRGFIRQFQSFSRHCTQGSFFASVEKLSRRAHNVLQPDIVTSVV